MSSSSSQASGLCNYAAFVDPETRQPRIGHYDLEQQTIQPLSLASGTPLADLYQVIEAGPERIVAAGEPVPAASVKLLAPVSGRDVLAVGKNYMEHAREFNSSGYDSSDKVAQPSHPVIFTKRATSIAAAGDPIYPHPGFTESIDYEGEIGVIISKAGFRVREEDAWDHVWGFTLINDLTARERQRDHKQFYIGKSPDTFCPMGPIAVPKEALPQKTLRLQTTVNGELRQDGTTDDLIFSIPMLVRTLSEGQTLQPGDVLATGTPAGVGIGRNPPVFLKPGDEVVVSATGLGSLHNKIARAPAVNGDTKTALSPALAQQHQQPSAFQLTNGGKSVNGTAGLTRINSKLLNYKHLGTGTEDIVFVHGLGGTMDYWTPLISALSLPESHSLHLFDLEGHGLSPTHPLSELSMGSFAADIGGVFAQAGVTPERPAVLVAHSMGCLAAMRFALDQPALVSRLVLVGPPPSPLPEAGSKGARARAALARMKGMAAVVDAVAGAGTSEHTKRANPVGLAAVRLSLLGQEPEAYAKACTALAGSVATPLEVEALRTDTLIVAGDGDNVSPPAVCEKYAGRIKGTKLTMLKNCGHWHVFEDVTGVAEAIRNWL